MNIIPPLEIPEDNPFKNDLLDRNGLALALTRLVHNHQSPFVMTLDAPWGHGKTEFLRMWALHLRNEKFQVIRFNAWNTDFCGDPLVALCSEIIEHIADSADTDITRAC